MKRFLFAFFLIIFSCRFIAGLPAIYHVAEVKQFVCPEDAGKTSQEKEEQKPGETDHYTQHPPYCMLEPTGPEPDPGVNQALLIQLSPGYTNPAYSPPDCA